MYSIMVVPIDPAPTDSLGTVQGHLVNTFHLPVTLLARNTLDPNPAFSPSRNQYHSSVLLSMLLRQYPDHEGKILALTSSDLFVPVLTYVFGEAQLNGVGALVSSHRLDDRLYGLPENKRLFEERLSKEAIHELGHTFGLVHCPVFSCVMHSSTAVEDIDTKSLEFCQDCRESLQQEISRKK